MNAKSGVAILTLFFGCALLPYSTFPAETTDHTRLFVPPAVTETGLTKEYLHARLIFQRLLAVSPLPQRDENYLQFIAPISLIMSTPRSSGGCFHEISNGIFSSEQPPRIDMPLLILWIDKKNGHANVSAFLLAHELAHIERITRQPMLCETYWREYTARQKEEELNADREAVRILYRAGYDGLRIAESGLLSFCRETTLGCPIHSLTGPSFSERLNAIREAAAHSRAKPF